VLPSQVGARAVTPARVATDYFPDEELALVPSGCTVLDCGATGGGQRSLEGAWPLGRIVNIVGDKSVGKTLIAIEACANFARKYPRGRIRYREAEAAFDVNYAASLGLPVDRVNFGPKGIKTYWSTVEDIFEDLRAAVIADQRSKVPSLYIVDSLDALGSRDLIGRDLDKGTYFTAKAKLMSEMLQELASEFNAANMLLIFISQIRDKIGVTFGSKVARAGGHALDFYASHIVFLRHVAWLVETVKGVERTTGVRIGFNFQKNKIAVPARKGEFVLRFGYGIDDLAACVNWMQSEAKDWLPEIGLKATATMAEVAKFLVRQEMLEDAAYKTLAKDVRRITTEAWVDVENGFRPKRQKYG